MCRRGFAGRGGRLVGARRGGRFRRTGGSGPILDRRDIARIVKRVETRMNSVSHHNPGAPGMTRLGWAARAKLQLNTPVSGSKPPVEKKPGDGGRRAHQRAGNLMSP